MARIFDFVDLSVGDHEVAAVKYIGSDIKCRTCVVGASSGACAFIGEATKSLNPIGVFVITLHDISNPIEYANGSEPQLSFVRDFRNEVFRIGNSVLIQFEESKLCMHECVNNVIEMTKAEDIIVLTSADRESFIGPIEPPKLFALSTIDEETVKLLPYPNKIENIAAGFLTLGPLHNIRVRVLHLVEDSMNMTSEAVEMWIQELSGILSDQNITDLADRASRSIRQIILRPCKAF